MLNVVTGPEGYPAAMLIRRTKTARGRGGETASLGIDSRLNGRTACDGGELWFDPAGSPTERRHILVPAASAR